MIFYPTPSQLKKQFLLNPEIIFLNHGSFGATPISVFNEYQRIQRELEFQPVEFLGRKATELMQYARAQLAKFLNVNRDDLVFVPNATHGINIVARSLDLHPDDEVLTTDHEYGAMDRAWQFLSLQKGFSYRPCHLSLPFDQVSGMINELFSHATSHTRVLFISHITSPTAILLPVQEICRIAREKGILTIIDGAHAPGQIPLDLSQVGPDFYTGNCHKWLCAPKGSAFLYTRKEMQSLINPLVVSWGWHSDSPGPSQYVDTLEWTGTRDLAPYLAVPAAIKFENAHNWSEIQKNCHSLADNLNTQLCSILDTDSLTSNDNWFGQMVSIPLPTHIPAETLKQTLYDDFRIEVPIVPWQNETLLRVSVQGYNTEEELDLLVKAIRFIYKV